MSDQLEEKPFEGNDMVAAWAKRAREEFPRFKAYLVEYLRENWIRVGGLGLSATQTYVMLSFFAPVWAWWLPIVGIIILEGGVPYWQWREEEADPMDIVEAPKTKEKGDVNVTKNEQERIANTMVWISLGMSALTMVAGVFIEVTQSQLAKVLKPDEFTTNLLGWLSLTGIFLLVTINLYADWRYKRADPLLSMRRETRQSERRLNRLRQATKANGELLITQKETKFLAQKYERASTRVGWNRASDAFADGVGVAAPKKRRSPRRARIIVDKDDNNA